MATMPLLPTAWATLLQGFIVSGVGQLHPQVRLNILRVEGVISGPCDILARSNSRGSRRAICQRSFNGLLILVSNIPLLW